MDFSSDPTQILARLHQLDTNQAVVTTAQASDILSLIQSPIADYYSQSLQIKTLALVLLKRWVQHLGFLNVQQPQSNAEQSQALLHDIVDIATEIVRHKPDGLASPETRSAALILGIAVGKLSNAHEKAVSVARTLITCVLETPDIACLPAGSDAISAIAGLLAAWNSIPSEALKGFTALFALLERAIMTLVAKTRSGIHLDVHNGAAVVLGAIDILSPLQPMMRAFASSHTSDNEFNKKSQFIASLIDFLDSSFDEHNPLGKRAMAAFASAGLMEGLLRSNHSAQCVPIIQRLENQLIQAVVESVQQNSRENHRVGEIIDQTGCGLATAILFRAVRRPLPSLEMLHCQAVALFRGPYTLYPLLLAVSNHSPATSFGASMISLTKHALYTNTALLTLTIAECSRLLPQERVLPILQPHIIACASFLYQQYDQYILSTPSDVVAAVDSTAIQLTLQRAFTSCVEVLDAIWAGQRSQHHAHYHQASSSINNRNNATRAGMVMSSELASVVLSVAADLQFCRLPSVKYSEIVKTAVEVLPSYPECVVRVMQQLPCYSDVPGVWSGGNSRGGCALWEIDPILAAKVQFLFTSLVPSLKALSEEMYEEHVLNRAASLAFLYILHPHKATSHAAHEFLRAAMAVSFNNQKHQRPRGEQLAPYYISQCMEAYPELLDPQQVMIGLEHIINISPVTSSVPILCLEEVLAKCSDVISSTMPRSQETGQRLFAAAAQQLMMTPLQTLDVSKQAFEGFLQRCPAAAAGSLAEILAVISNSDDCVRKVDLACWYQDLCTRYVI